MTDENYKSSISKIVYSIRLILSAYKSYIGHPLGDVQREHQNLRISENTFRKILHREMETIAGIENLSLYNAKKDCREIWLAMADSSPDHCIRSSVVWRHNKCQKDDSLVNDKDLLDARVDEIREQIERECAKKAADLMILEDILSDQSSRVKAQHLKFIRTYFGLSYGELAYKFEKMVNEDDCFTSALEIEKIESNGSLLWKDESFFLRAYVRGRLDEREERKEKGMKIRTMIDNPTEKYAVLTVTDYKKEERKSPYSGNFFLSISEITLSGATPNDPNCVKECDKILFDHHWISPLDEDGLPTSLSVEENACSDSQGNVSVRIWFRPLQECQIEKLDSLRGKKAVIHREDLRDFKLPRDTSEAFKQIRVRKQS